MDTGHGPDLSAVLRGHRSIRRYRSDPVEPALVEEVLGEAIAGGSSSGNLNSVSIVLTREAASKERLYELHFRQPMVRQAPLLMTFCADWYRTRRWLALRAARDNFNNLLGWHVAVCDAMIVAQNACLGFEARGLGICYLGTTLHAMGAIADLLALPHTCLPVTTVVVGYPDEDPPKRDRLPLSALVHDEHYRERTDAELLAEFADREVNGWNRYMSMPGLAEHINAAGITSLAQFYTSDVKYAPSVWAKDSATLEALLRAKGFLGDLAPSPGERRRE